MAGEDAAAVALHVAAAEAVEQREEVAGNAAVVARNVAVVVRNAAVVARNGADNQEAQGGLAAA